MEPCVFLSPDPFINDVYKVPEMRYLCRCAERLAVMKQYSDRFVGGAEDCKSCAYYKPVTNK